MRLTDEDRMDRSRHGDPRYNRPGPLWHPPVRTEPDWLIAELVAREAGAAQRIYPLFGRMVNASDYRFCTGTDPETNQPI
jgi:hypothetical protein